MSKSAEQDIEHIRKMMERSAQFISLSGLSGIFAGLFAIIAAMAALVVFKKNGIDYFSDNPIVYSKEVLQSLIIICLVTLLAAIGSAIYFTYKKSRKNNISPWNSLTRRLLISFMVPLVAGGIFSLALYYNFQYALIAPVMLVFYGIALINTGKYTYSDVNYLGYAELLLGLTALFFTGYGLLFWVIGFGLLHIIYGSVLYKKYR